MTRKPHTIRVSVTLTPAEAAIVARVLAEARGAFVDLTETAIVASVAETFRFAGTRHAPSHP